MKKKVIKTGSRVGKSENTVNQTGPIGWSLPKVSPTERIKQLEREVESAEKRTDIEQVALQVTGYVEAISNLRYEIARCEKQLSEYREALAKSLLAHQSAISKFKELGAIPQPTV